MAKAGLPLASENRLMRRLLRTGLQPAGSPLPGLSGLTGKDHFCHDSRRPRGAARHLEDSRAPALRLHLQRPAPAAIDLTVGVAQQAMDEQHGELWGVQRAWVYQLPVRGLSMVR